jgi:hypothetical protein
MVGPSQSATSAKFSRFWGSLRGNDLFWKKSCCAFVLAASKKVSKIERCIVTRYHKVCYSRGKRLCDSRRVNDLSMQLVTLFWVPRWGLNARLANEATQGFYASTRLRVATSKSLAWEEAVPRPR